MLIVLSNPLPLRKECLLINRLFEQGMELFHLRKPDSSEEDYNKLLKGISSAHRKKVVLHRHHHLAQNHGIQRLHFPAKDRKALDGDQLEAMKEDAFIYSTSIHSVMEYGQLPHLFSYTFLSPVFDSISKPGYKAQPHNLSSIDKRSNGKIIALGGVSTENCQLPTSMGYDGMAVMGAVWGTTQPIEEFIQIKKRCLIPVPSC